MCAHLQCVGENERRLPLTMLTIRTIDIEYELHCKKMMKTPSTTTTTFDGKRINYVISSTHEIIYISPENYLAIGCSVLTAHCCQAETRLDTHSCINLHINSDVLGYDATMHWNMCVARTLIYVSVLHGSGAGVGSHMSAPIEN